MYRCSEVDLNFPVWFQEKSFNVRRNVACPQYACFAVYILYIYILIYF